MRPDPNDSDTRRQLDDEEATRAGVRPSEQPTNHDDDEDEDSLENRIKRKLSHHDGASDGGRGDPLIGSTINERFVITSKIGAGGMGAVYRAKQLGMGRDVAIKVLLRELTENETVLRRFHLEALAVSKLKHPNTIQIFDFGETQDGLLYIAMELLEGKPLQNVLNDEKQLAVKRSLHIMEQVAKSLREAHSKGIVHRDLKPDNIFLQAVGEDSDYAKVLDFGVAKVAEGDGQQKTLTKAGSIFGTPKYMSPEQSRGTDIDARSDIYAMGIILYELLTGRVPFNAENPLGILIKHLQEVPPAFQAIRPDLVIPEQVERYVHKMLAKSVDERPQSTEAVIRELEKLREEVPPLFRNVVTRADAEAAGIEIQALSLTALDTDIGASDGGGVTMTRAETLHQMQMMRRRKWPLILMAAVILVLGSAGVLYASLSPLDKGYYAFTAIDESTMGLVPEFEVDSVVVTIVSVPEEAAVMNEKGEEIGKTPISLRRNKGAQAERYTLKFEGYRDYIRSIEYEKDGAVVATLEKIVELKPVVVTKPVTTVESGTVVKPVDKPVVVKPVEMKDPDKMPDTKPTPYDSPRKVDQTKDNPYGTTTRKPEPVKDNPYD